MMMTSITSSSSSSAAAAAATTATATATAGATQNKDEQVDVISAVETTPISSSTITTATTTSTITTTDPNETEHHNHDSSFLNEGNDEANDDEDDDDDPKKTIDKNNKDEQPVVVVTIISNEKMTTETSEGNNQGDGDDDNGGVMDELASRVQSSLTVTTSDVADTGTAASRSSSSNKVTDVDGSNNDKLDENSSTKKNHKAKCDGATIQTKKDGKKDDDDDDEYIPDTLRQIAKWIQSSKRIVVLTGAGISVAAGIPDFRTPGTGLYDNLQKYNLPYPEAVFDLNFYRRHPQPFCSLAKQIWPGFSHSPTLTHTFLALLARNHQLLRLYTQNIDGLEYLAQLPPALLVECHGHFRTASCIECGNKDHGHNDDAVQTTIVHYGKVPTCLKCHGYVKPDIVFFGEGLPDRFSNLLPHDLEDTDLMLVMGTSLQVAPVSMIPSMVSRGCRRILLNRELVGDFGQRSRRHKHQQKQKHKQKKPKHPKQKKKKDDDDDDGNDDDDDDDDGDLFYAGDCDDSVRIIAKLLGWSEALTEWNEKTRIKETTMS